jgi:hypothetical protein
MVNARVGDVLDAPALPEAPAGCERPGPAKQANHPGARPYRPSSRGCARGSTSCACARIRSLPVTCGLSREVSGRALLICARRSRRLAAGSNVYSELKNLVVWVKTNAGQGSFYRSQHELIFVFKSGDGEHQNNGGRMTRAN